MNRSYQKRVKKALQGLLAAKLIFAFCLSQQVQAEASPLRLGFTQSVFSARNENDVLAAMKVWMRMLSDENNLKVDDEPVVYSALKLAEAGVRENVIDAITLSIGEHITFQQTLISGPYFRPVVNGKSDLEFVLVCRHQEKSRFTWIDLQGKRLCVHESYDTLESMAWLGFEFARSGMKAPADELGSIEKTPKLSRSVLSVFFSSNDACLTTRSGYEQMVEMNPQIGNKLSIVASSPRIHTSAFCFRRTLAGEQKEKLWKAVQDLDKSVTGKQVLNVFKADGMRIISNHELNASRKLVQQWHNAAAVETPNLLNSAEGGAP